MSEEIKYTPHFYIRPVPPSFVNPDTGKPIAEPFKALTVDDWLEAKAEIARLTALLAEAREGLTFYAQREFFTVMPDDGKTRVVPINNEDGTFAYWFAFVNDDGEKARAILAKLGA